MDLIQPVVNAIAILSGMLALAVGVAYIAVALARISLDFFRS